MTVQQNRQLSEIEKIELEAENRGYVKLTEEESKVLAGRVQKLVRFVRTDGVQDVIISENKPVVVKNRGVISNNHVLDEWNGDTFSYFVWEISNQSVDKDMDMRKKLIAQNRCFINPIW